MEQEDGLGSGSLLLTNQSQANLETDQSEAGTLVNDRSKSEVTWEISQHWSNFPYVQLSL